jgi:hypothetical protein
MHTHTHTTTMFSNNCLRLLVCESQAPPGAARLRRDCSSLSRWRRACSSMMSRTSSIQPLTSKCGTSGINTDACCVSWITRRISESKRPSSLSVREAVKTPKSMVSASWDKAVVLAVVLELISAECKGCGRGLCKCVVHAVRASVNRRLATSNAYMIYGSRTRTRTYMFILEKHEADERGKRIDIERTKHFFGCAIRRRC